MTKLKTSLVKEKPFPREELIDGFKRFVKSNPSLWTSWDKLDSVARNITLIILNELVSFSPLTLANYWAIHHNRFCRQTTQVNLGAMNNILYHYTCFVAQHGVNFQKRLALLPEVKTSFAQKVKEKVQAKIEKSADNAV